LKRRLTVAIVLVVLGALVVTSIRSALAATSPVVRLAAGTLDPVDGWSEFHRELQRARRFERSFAIVRFSIVSGSDPAHVRDRVASMSRRVDRIWLDEGDLFMLLPEADPGGAETAVVRIRERVGDALAAEMTANFPGNGITSGALIASLYDGASAPVAMPVGATSRDIVPIGAAVAPDSGESETAEIS